MAFLWVYICSWRSPRPSIAQDLVHRLKTARRTQHVACIGGRIKPTCRPCASERWAIGPLSLATEPEILHSDIKCGIVTAKLSMLLAEVGPRHILQIHNFTGNHAFEVSVCWKTVIGLPIITNSQVEAGRCTVNIVLGGIALTSRCYKHVEPYDILTVTMQQY